MPGGGGGLRRAPPDREGRADGRTPRRMAPRRIGAPTNERTDGWSDRRRFGRPDGRADRLRFGRGRSRTGGDQ